MAIEVYPAATLAGRQLKNTGYKSAREEAAGVRREIVEALTTQFTFDAAATDAMVASDHGLDAARCGLAALDFTSVDEALDVTPGPHSCQLQTTGERDESVEPAARAAEPREAAGQRTAPQELTELLLDDVREPFAIAEIRHLCEKRFEVVAHKLMEHARRRPA